MATGSSVRGRVLCCSGQTGEDELCTERWDSQNRFPMILYSAGTDGSPCVFSLLKVVTKPKRL